MKKLVYIICLVVYVACCPCNKEIPPPIDFSIGQDATYVLSNIPAAQNKNVLIEDFTGVRCPNCPNAHDEIRTIQNNNPNRVFTYSMHPKNSVLTIPYTTMSGYQDFRTDEATSLYSDLNAAGINGLPAGATDRTLFTGQSGLLNITPSAWPSFVALELAKTTPINLEIGNQFTDSTRELVVTAKATLTTGMPNDTIFFSLAIVESGIVNPQEQNTAEIDTFYIHNNVLRKMLTSYNGSQLIGKYEPGRVFQKGFTFTLPPLWNADKCKVVAFVHKGGNIKEVWHVVEKAVK